MSQYYEVDGESVWNPSTGVSQVFLGHLRVYEEQLGLPSGFGPMHNDECAIDPVALEAFLRALLDWYGRTSHPVLAQLTEGFAATLLAVAFRAGIEVGPQDPAAGRRGWRARVFELAEELRPAVSP